MHTVDTVVVGAGHAGLAVSRLLSQARREHVVLDRGRVAERWRTERWDSLHLLTPNWMTRLPGWYYTGLDPEGFLSAGRFVRHLERYAASFEAPVLEGQPVRSLTAAPGGGYLLHGDSGTWRARHLVIATGPHGAPRVPDAVRSSDVEVLHTSQYRNPGRLAAGGVLVVGASASGVQVAHELAKAGRDVTLAVGRHTRLPRSYRGMDMFWWLEATGRLARTIDTVPDSVAARRETSLQLVGGNHGQLRQAGLDLQTLQDDGVRVTGRLRELRGRHVELAGDLGNHVASAQAAMHRMLDAADAHADTTGLTAELLPATRPTPVRVPSSPTSLDLGRERIGTVVLATGFRAANDWVQLPVLDPDGWFVQHRGVTRAPGVYVVGQRFQHRRDSGLIDGARHDAQLVVAHLLAHSGARSAALEEEAA